MAGVHNHLRENIFLSKAFSDIDKDLFKEYNVTYCTYEKNSVFILILSDCCNDVLKTKWREVKSHCLERGIELDFDIITEDEYTSWVRDRFPTYKMFENGYLSINDR